MSHAVSLYSSRDSSPLLDGSSDTTSRRTSSSTTTSINDLSQFLTRHTLTTRRSSTTLDIRLHNPLASPPRTTSRLINSRRQSLVHRQNSSSSNLDRVATLVDDLQQNNQYIAYPSTLDDDISSPSMSPDELPTITNPYLNLMHHPSATHVPNAEDATSHNPHQLYPDYHKMNKDMRHVISSDTLNRGKVRVMKPIKMRTRPKRRPKKRVDGAQTTVT